MEPQKVPLWKVTLTLGISWEKKGSFPERRVNQVRSVLSGGTRPQTPRVCPSLTYLTSSWFVTFHCFGDCFHIKDTTLLLCVPFTPHTLTMCGEMRMNNTHTITCRDRRLHCWKHKPQEIPTAAKRSSKSTMSAPLWTSVLQDGTGVAFGLGQS